MLTERDDSININRKFLINSVMFEKFRKRDIVNENILVAKQI